jgi:hypothetical protein
MRGNFPEQDIVKEKFKDDSGSLDGKVTEKGLAGRV